MKKNKIRPDETPVQLGKSELLESTRHVQHPNGDTTDYVDYRVPPRMEIYGQVPALPSGMEWRGDKERRRREKEREKYWRQKRKEERDE